MAAPLSMFDNSLKSLRSALLTAAALSSAKLDAAAIKLEAALGIKLNRALELKEPEELRLVDAAAAAADPIEF